MKKIITVFKIVLILFFISISNSCGEKDDIKPDPKPNPEPKDEVIPKWNKVNTVSIFLFSKLNENSISEANYNEISTFLKSEEFQVSILDRSDIELSKNFNGGVKVTDDLKRYSVYNLLELKEKMIKGSTVIFNNLVEKQKTHRIDNSCTITSTDILFKKDIKIPLAISTFSNKNQFDKAQKTISYIVSENKVLILKIKPNLVASLKKKAEEVNKTYKVQEVVKQAEYSVVVVSPKYWVTRKTEKVKSLSDKLNVFKIQIEANVFY